MMSVHTKKAVKGTDLYKGLKTQAEERKELERQQAIERAKAKYKGVSLHVHPKILAAINKRRPG